MDIFLHITVGAALAALVCWNHWFMVSATFIYAFLREQAQHRWIIEPWDGAYLFPDIGYKLHRVTKRTFSDFGWLTGHRIWEVFQWVIGAFVGCLIWELVN